MSKTKAPYCCPPVDVPCVSGIITVLSLVQNTTFYPNRIDYNRNMLGRVKDINLYFELNPN